MDVGYAQVSTRDQDLDLHRDALQNAGVEKIYWEKVSSRKEDRPELAKALGYFREGDVLVVYKLERLGRSLKELLEIVSGLEQRGVGFCSLQEDLDTTTPGGRLVFHIFASLAEFERELIRKRTMAGLQAARARGRKGGGGRKPKMDERKIALARKLMADPEYSVAEICRTFGVSSSTLYRHTSPGETETPLHRPRHGSVTHIRALHGGISPLPSSMASCPV